MGDLHEILSSDTGLAEYVEHELASALDRLPVAWKMSETELAVERGDAGEAKWLWARATHGELTWRIYSPVSGSIEFYYDLLVSRDLEMLVLTHSNLRAGLYDARWVVKSATLIPFSALLDDRSLFRSEPLHLGRLVSETCLGCQPNLDWPT
jgi:hypothetical protein